ncbi:MAG: exo-alpha-sialidase [Pirellulales bacterium]|nr:exo-alpha-sialidase [Pirellulales bacterium]
MRTVFSLSHYIIIAGIVACCLQRSKAEELKAAPGLVLERHTIARDDKHHLAWPMVCIAANGDLVCSYAVGDEHGGGKVPQAVVRISKDQGHTWSNPIVVDTLYQDKGEGFMMCRWVSRLNDNSLLLASDWSLWKRKPPGAPHNWGNDPENGSKYRRTWLYRSTDNGLTWTGPEKTNCMTVTLTMKQISDGTLFLTGSLYRVGDDSWRQVLYRSTDNGKTWSKPITVLDAPKYSPNEGCIVEMPDGTLVTYERTENETAGAIKMISDDKGLTWKGPFAAGNCWVNGRVFANRLSTGEVLVVHRIGKCHFGFFVETPKTALSRIPYDSKTYKSPALNWGFIDIENKSHWDGGYGGWVELPDGDIYAVNYITDDAPKPQIRGYRLSRKALLQPHR